MAAVKTTTIPRLDEPKNDSSSKTKSLAVMSGVEGRNRGQFLPWNGHRIKDLKLIQTKRRVSYWLQDYCFDSIGALIHRDLAARNVLLCGNSCKISDFGLSLLGQLHRQRKLSRAPVRWLALETLTQGIYISKTDGWSFGVTIFEIFTDGSRLYDEVKKNSVIAQRVIMGLRLRLLVSTPSACKEMLSRCFETVPTLRSSFAELRKSHVPVSLHFKLKAMFSKRVENTKRNRIKF